MDLGDVDVEGTDRKDLEPLPAWLLAFGDGHAGNALTLQAAVQAGAGQETELQGAKHFAHGSLLTACRLSVSPHPGSRNYTPYINMNGWRLSFQKT